MFFKSWSDYILQNLSSSITNLRIIVVNLVFWFIPNQLQEDSNNLVHKFIVMCGTSMNSLHYSDNSESKYNNFILNNVICDNQTIEQLCVRSISQVAKLILLQLNRSYILKHFCQNRSLISLLLILVSDWGYLCQGFNLYYRPLTFTIALDQSQ